MRRPSGPGISPKARHLERVLRLASGKKCERIAVLLSAGKVWPGPGPAPGPGKRQRRWVRARGRGGLGGGRGAGPVAGDSRPGAGRGLEIDARDSVQLCLVYEEVPVWVPAAGTAEPRLHVAVRGLGCPTEAQAQAGENSCPNCLFFWEDVVVVGLHHLFLPTPTAQQMGGRERPRKKKLSIYIKEREEKNSKPDKRIR